MCPCHYTVWLNTSSYYYTDGKTWNSTWTMKSLHCFGLDTRTSLHSHDLDNQISLHSHDLDCHQTYMHYHDPGNQACIHVVFRTNQISLHCYDTDIKPIYFIIWTSNLYAVTTRISNLICIVVILTNQISLHCHDMDIKPICTISPRTSNLYTLSRLGYQTYMHRHDMGYQTYMHYPDVDIKPICIVTTRTTKLLYTFNRVGLFLGSKLQI